MQTTETVDVTRTGIVVLLLVMVVIVLIAKGKIKLPDLGEKWKKGWWKGLIGLLIGVIATSFIYHLWPNQWDSLQKAHGWYFWLVVIGFNTLCAFLGYNAERKEKHALAGGAKAHDPHASGTSFWQRVGAGIFILLLGHLGLWWYEKSHEGGGGNEMPTNGVVLLPPPAPKPREHYTIEVPPDKEARIPIPIGATCFTEPAESNQVVWVRWEGDDEPHKDWRGRPSGGAIKRPGANYKYLRSAESFPVKVEVEITYN